MDKKIIAYKLVKEKFSDIDAIVEYEISRGWQPFGSPMLYGYGLAQAMVKYTITDEEVLPLPPLPPLPSLPPLPPLPPIEGDNKEYIKLIYDKEKVRRVVEDVNEIVNSVDNVDVSEIDESLTKIEKSLVSEVNRNILTKVIEQLSTETTA